MDLQLIEMRTVIIVLMTPLLLFYGLPFLIAARLCYVHTKLWLSDRQRLLLASVITALGVAPCFDVYQAPRPIYTALLDGQSISATGALISVLLTWVIVAAQLLWLSKQHSAKV